MTTDEFSQKLVEALREVAQKGGDTKEVVRAIARVVEEDRDV